MAKKTSKPSTKLVTIDRRGRGDRRQTQPAAPAEGRRTVVPLGERRKKKPRRRQIDPTTCERDYTDKEIEFMQAVDAYKHRSGNRFPSCQDVLDIIDRLGYQSADKGDDPESEFQTVLEAYKQSSGRMFPTCSEVLEVLRGLGYQQAAEFDINDEEADCGGVVGSGRRS